MAWLPLVEACSMGSTPATTVMAVAASGVWPSVATTMTMLPFCKILQRDRRRARQHLLKIRAGATALTACRPIRASGSGDRPGSARRGSAGAGPCEEPAAGAADPSGRFSSPAIHARGQPLRHSGVQLFHFTIGRNGNDHRLLGSRIIHRNRRASRVYRLDWAGEIAEASADNLLRLQRGAVVTSGAAGAELVARL